MQLLSRLLNSKAKVPDGEVIYAVGDIHGRDDLLGQLHESIEADLQAGEANRRARVIYLGDYIDRGPDSKAVLDRLLDHPVKRAECTFLKGNHEDTLLRFLDGQKGGERWLALGAGATAKSYGVCLRKNGGHPLPTEAIRERMNAAIPQRHLSFLRALNLFQAAGDYLFVHAGIRPGRRLANQDPQDMLWIRGEFLRSRCRHEHVIVHGHAAGRDVVVRRNRICVDTMAYATDRLNCLVLEGTSQRFITSAL
ncbi:metallophosphoesterase family protein [Pelagibius marinus]|uniref:metallophosphoesterase family protein n=1 Tax=Pelagibius marinus TaxID=2762760 RepID=UPI00187287D4|nr:metallophosphoesterase family protein [Pelagibius marinus]